MRPCSLLLCGSPDGDVSTVSPRCEIPSPAVTSETPVCFAAPPLVTMTARCSGMGRTWRGLTLSPVTSRRLRRGCRILYGPVCCFFFIISCPFPCPCPVLSPSSHLLNGWRTSPMLCLILVVKFLVKPSAVTYWCVIVLCCILLRCISSGRAVTWSNAAT